MLSSTMVIRVAFFTGVRFSSIFVSRPQPVERASPTKPVDAAPRRRRPIGDLAPQRRELERHTRHTVIAIDAGG